jgi:hypothetical protein
MFIANGNRFALEEAIGKDVQAKCLGMCRTRRFESRDPSALIADRTEILRGCRFSLGIENESRGRFTDQRLTGGAEAGADGGISQVEDATQRSFENSSHSFAIAYYSFCQLLQLDCHLNAGLHGVFDRHLADGLGKVERSTLVDLRTQTLRQPRRVVGEDLRLKARTRHRDVGEAAVHEIRVCGLIHVDQNAVGSEPLRTVAGDRIAVIEALRTRLTVREHVAANYDGDQAGDLGDRSRKEVLERGKAAVERRAARLCESNCGHDENQGCKSEGWAHPMRSCDGCGSGSDVVSGEVNHRHLVGERLCKLLLLSETSADNFLSPITIGELIIQSAHSVIARDALSGSQPLAKERYEAQLIVSMRSRDSVWRNLHSTLATIRVMVELAVKFVATQEAHIVSEVPT